MTVVSCAVEGDLDEVVARRMLDHVGLTCGPVYGRDGKDKLRRDVGGYASGARFHPWFVLVDLDADECAAGLVAEWVPVMPPLMHLRVAVREVEAWLLADRRHIAEFLGVSHHRVPGAPEAVVDAKQQVVNLARRSRRRATREGVPPRPGSGRTIGPLYVTEMSRFVRDAWDIDAAAQASESLRRCLAALGRIPGR